MITLWIYMNNSVCYIMKFEFTGTSVTLSFSHSTVYTWQSIHKPKKFRTYIWCVLCQV